MPEILAVNAIITDADAAAALGITTSDRLVQIVNAASTKIEAYCRSVFKPRSFTKTLDGTTNPLLDLDAPISSVTSAQLGDDVLVVDVDYQVLADRGQLFRLSGWAASRGKRPVGVRGVIVVAVLGYGTIALPAVPEDVKEACRRLVGRWHSRGVGGEFQSERIGDYSYSRFPYGAALAVGMDEDLAAILSPYVRHGF